MQKSDTSLFFLMMCICVACSGEKKDITAGGKDGTLKETIPAARIRNSLVKVSVFVSLRCSVGNIQAIA